MSSELAGRRADAAGLAIYERAKLDLTNGIGAIMRSEQARPLVVEPLSREDVRTRELVRVWLNLNGLLMSSSTLAVESADPEPARFEDADDSGESEFERVKKQVAVDVLRATEKSGLFREIKARVLAEKYLEYMRSNPQLQPDVINDESEKARIELLLGGIQTWLIKLDLRATIDVLEHEASFVYDDLVPADTRDCVSAMIARHIARKGTEPSSLDAMQISGDHAASGL